MRPALDVATVLVGSFPLDRCSASTCEVARGSHKCDKGEVYPKSHKRGILEPSPPPPSEEVAAECTGELTLYSTPQQACKEEEDLLHLSKEATLSLQWQGLGGQATSMTKRMTRWTRRKCTSIQSRTCNVAPCHMSFMLPSNFCTS